MNEYVKFMTEQFTHFINNRPKKARETKESDPFKNDWFGLFPFLLRVLWKK